MSWLAFPWWLKGLRGAILLVRGGFGRSDGSLYGCGRHSRGEGREKKSPICLKNDQKETFHDFATFEHESCPNWREIFNLSTQYNIC
ncbi:hypothetical protein [Pseudoruegeria sp. SHC-113]|uniref:hypothetical protein n=1 Tax=Pseudoruegeria sp. SHC-113 TaxID=2855439 RepID=UPI0021BB14E0|nr:hypothetical protein [Pseudoruegeria sp. SHC-113]MCT8160776.1 hypothetical protein [Pseudoruegeria sp. SHC-113]